jgi:DNA-binding CsgD family transcriptional regulator
MAGNSPPTHNYNHSQNNSSLLTPRELDIISLLMRGSSTAEIAAGLELSERTVYSHIDSIKQKLEISSRAELLRYVREHGLK